MKLTNNPIGVTIGIPAYNEEKNITKLLLSINNQKQYSYKLEKILIVSDGSCDSTVAVANSLKIERLQIIESNERKGKSARMHELFQRSQSEILVMLDADIILKTPYVVEYLVQPLINGESTLTSGHPVKLKVENVSDKTMEVSAFFQDYIKQHYLNGESVYSCHGRITAVKKNIYKRIDLPFNNIGNDAFLYFKNLTLGGSFAYVNKAYVTYKMPQSFNDFSKQERRFQESKTEAIRIFGSLARRSYKIPVGIKFQAILEAIFRFHLYFCLYVVYQLRSRVTCSDTVSHNWQISESTKNIE